jgi:hypothetical protein
MKKGIIAATIVLGGLGGSLGVANLIEVFKPYSSYIVLGTTFVSGIVALLVVKANEKKV